MANENSKKDETMVAAFELGRFSEYLYLCSKTLLHNTEACSAGEMTKSMLLKSTRDICKSIIAQAEALEDSISLSTVVDNAILKEDE